MAVVIDEACAIPLDSEGNAAVLAADDLKLSYLRKEYDKYIDNSTQAESFLNAVNACKAERSVVRR